jgi:negative regulator of sigma E activity
VTLGNSVLVKSDLDFVLRKVYVVALAALALLAVVLAVLWFSRQANSSSSMPAPAVHKQYNV